MRQRARVASLTMTCGSRVKAGGQRADPAIDRASQRRYMVAPAPTRWGVAKW